MYQTEHAFLEVRFLGLMLSFTDFNNTSKYYSNNPDSWRVRDGIFHAMDSLAKLQQQQGQGKL